jgi:O-antigen/teichoic acid export membrane protein
VVLNVLIAPFLAGRQLLVAIVSLSLLPDAYSALATARIKAQQRMEVSAAITLGTRLAYSLVGGVLLWRGYDERVLLAVYGGVSTLGALAFGLVLRRCLRVRGSRPGRSWDALRDRGKRRASLYHRWRDVMGESLPFAITSIVAMLYARADLLVLSAVQGDAVAGRYGMAYRLWEAVGLIPASFLDALFPELSRLSGQGTDLGRLRALYRRGWLIVGTGGLLLVVAAQVGAATAIAVTYGRTPDADHAVGILRVLSLAFPFTYLYLLNGHALYAIAQQQRVTMAMVGVTATKLLLDVWVVPRWSAWGAAGVALAVEVLLFAWLQLYAWRSGLRAYVAGGRGGLVATGDVHENNGSSAG